MLNKRNRVLVWGLSNNKAGTEAVINSYASINSDTPFDFITFEEPNNYIGLFSRDRDNRFFVIHSKSQNPIQYYIDLKRHVNEHAYEYKALWFNTNHAANIDLLRLAHRYAIPRRIVHSHNSHDPNELALKVMCHINANACTRLATERWACSVSAGNYLFRGTPFTLIPNLVDSKACSFNLDKRTELRSSLKVGNSLVIGNVGRLSHQKNQGYLIDLLGRLRKQGVDCHLVIVGDGELRDCLLNQANNIGVLSRVHLVGMQNDIQAYLSAFDVFAFPSYYEGLPVSLLEAQFNGVPCLCSDAITDDAIISNQVCIIPLTHMDHWVSCVLSSKRESCSLNERAAHYDLQLARQYVARLFE